MRGSNFDHSRWIAMSPLKQLNGRSPVMLKCVSDEVDQLLQAFSVRSSTWECRA